MNGDALTSRTATPQAPLGTMEAGSALKRIHLLRMKSIALALLIAMLILFAMSAVLREAHPWLRWVYAFAEAAAIGAIADWFAVTALFRHPLGLPIPHTAIIPRNKDEMGASLGDFVEHNFLTPDNVMRRLERRNFAHAGAHWLVNPENSEGLAKRICAMIPRALEALDDENVQRFLDQIIMAQLERLDVARIAGELLAALTAENRHQELLDLGLNALETWMRESRELIKAKFGEASKYTPGFFDKYVVSRFVEGITVLLHEIASDPDHEVRARFSKATAELIVKLNASPEFQQRGEALKRDLLAHLRRNERYRHLWAELRNRILADLASDHSIVGEHLSSALMTAGDALQRDAVLQQKLNGWILRVVERLMLEHRHQISLLIAGVVARWDAREVTQKVEMEIGKDLQFIRINGTIVGGMVGVLLYLCTRLPGL